MSELPMIRLSTASILVDELDRRGLETDEILDGVGLRRSAFEDSNTFVPALVIYRLCEDAAKAADDHMLLAKLGQSLNTATWEPMVKAHASAQDVGQLLTRFAIEATQHSSAVTEMLEVHGARAVFYGHRSFAPSFVPAQIDGFYVGFILSILRRAVRDFWNPQEVIVTVSDPTALPPFMFGIKALKGGRHGHRIAFPATWMTIPFERDDFLRRSDEEAVNEMPARKAAAAVKQVLKPQVGEMALTSKSAAELCGINERSLARLLEKEGTSLGEILSGLKKDYAVSMLKNTDRSVLDISEALGYATATSFTRSFKSWVGQTPSEFRKELS